MLLCESCGINKITVPIAESRVGRKSNGRVSDEDGGAVGGIDAFFVLLKYFRESDGLIK